MAEANNVPIEHVVVLMMENNGFDRMLGAMSAVHRGLDGIDPARPHHNPAATPGKPVLTQRETQSRNIDRDPKHYLANSLAQYADGTNSGFVADFVRTHPNSTDEERQEIMGYFPRGFLPGLHTLAENFVVCDHWFSSLPGPTWINRLFAHSGTSNGHVNEPGGLFSSKLHMYDQRTLYDELTEAGVPWRIYFGDVPQTLVLSHQWSHLDHYRRFGRWHADIARGDLPAYTFIEPSYFGPEQNDQHPPHDIMRGDALIADVYNTLLKNPALFAKTLLIVLYDEHGGFFDHVIPPATVPPDDHTEHFGFDLLGFRVPAVFCLSDARSGGDIDRVRPHQPVENGKFALARGRTARPARRAIERPACGADLASHAARGSPRSRCRAGYSAGSFTCGARRFQGLAVWVQPSPGEPDPPRNPQIPPDAAGT
jgi:Phospholipase C